MLTLQSWRPQIRGGMNLLSHLDYNVEANRGDHGHDDNDQDDKQWQQVTHNFGCAAPFLPLWDNFEKGRAIPWGQLDRVSASLRESKWVDRDDHWPWWQWPRWLWWQWSRWPWVHLLLTFLFCLRTLICRGSKDHATNISTFIMRKQYFHIIEMIRFPVQAQTIVTLNKASSSWVLWGSLVCEEWDDAEKAARALVSPQSKHTSTPFNRSVKMSNYK